MKAWLATVIMIVVHTVDGYEVSINPEQITSLQASSEAKQQGPNTLIVKGVRCVVGLSNGKFVSVVEECSAVRQEIEEKREDHP